ncbi:hypothetical protein TcYC6_0023950 [Trypanosoma cruzi]|nr:hypothetical protein TcYC6_0023950 [Trypanosoma cruzi]
MWESETLSVNICLRVHTLDTKQPELIRCLEEFRELLPTRVLHSADRFRAAAASHVWSKFLFPIVNGGSQRTLSVNICLRVHTLDTNNPELIRCLEEFRELLPTRVLHSADRFRAAAASHVVVQFLFPDCEWWESEALSVNICLRVQHTGHQTTLNYPLLGGISRALAHTGAALG